MYKKVHNPGVCTEKMFYTQNVLFKTQYTRYASIEYNVLSKHNCQERVMLATLDGATGHARFEFQTK